MELRGCSHLHYIQAIKDGSIVKTMNIGKRGKPALKLKRVEEIYEAESSNGLHPTRACHPKDDFRGSFYGYNRFEMDSSCSSSGEGKSIKTESDTDEISYNAGNNLKDGESDDSECDMITLNQLADIVRAKIEPDTCEINCSDGDNKKDSDADDFGCDTMPLCQLKKMIGRKKRKHSSYVDLTKINDQNYSPNKEECPDLQPIEDDCDLNITLSSLKLKSSKRKKMCSNKRDSLSSQCATAICVKSEEISTDQDIMYFSDHRYAPINVTTENIDPGYSNFRSVACCTQIDSNVVESEMLEPGNSLVLENEDVLLSEKVNDFVNGASNNHLECTEVEPLPDSTARCSDTMKVDDIDISSNLSSVLSCSEPKEQEDINNPPCHDLYQEILSTPEDHNSTVYDSLQCYSIPHENSRHEEDIDEVQQTDFTFNSSLQFLGPSDGGGMYILEDAKDDFSCKIKTGVENSLVHNDCLLNKSDKCLSTDNFITQVNDDSHTVNSVEIDLCYTSNQIPTSELGVNDHHSELHHPSDSLFSNRKVVSPASQENLCKAMDAIELHDDIQQHKCMEESHFQKQTQNNISRDIEEFEFDGNGNGEGPEHNNGNEITKYKKIKRRPKNSSKASRPKGIVKDQQLSHSFSHISSGCSSIKSCSRSAVAFSQRQMRDIESLAMKLTKELNSMKDIVGDALQSEAYLSTSSKYNSDEIKAAIANAKNVEENANKWLSMMARDCNRFCEIMLQKSDTNENIDSGNLIYKQRKKITFADEAGGELCHVKVFEDDDLEPVVSL